MASQGLGRWRRPIMWGAVGLAAAYIGTTWRERQQTTRPLRQREADEWDPANTVRTNARKSMAVDNTPPKVAAPAAASAPVAAPASAPAIASKAPPAATAAKPAAAATSSKPAPVAAASPSTPPSAQSSDKTPVAASSDANARTSTPVADSSSSSTASATSADAPDELESDESSESSWLSSMYLSAPVNTFPGRPFVSSLVAVQIPSRVHARDSDVLVETYGHNCPGCKIAAPVIDTVAEIIRAAEAQPAAAVAPSTTPSDFPGTPIDGPDSAVPAPSAHGLAVLLMDAGRNHIPPSPSFLTSNEDRGTPTFKFFPRCGSNRYSAEVRARPECQAVAYRGRLTVESLINFLHERRVAQENIREFTEPSPSIDVARAHELGRAVEPLVRDRLTAIHAGTFAEEAARDPTASVLQNSPCADKGLKRFEFVTLSRYRSYVQPAEEEKEEQALADAWMKCYEQPDDRAYWLQVRHQSNRMLPVEDQVQMPELEEASQTKHA